LLLDDSTTLSQIDVSGQAEQAGPGQIATLTISFILLVLFITLVAIFLVVYKKFRVVRPSSIKVFENPIYRSTDRIAEAVDIVPNVMSQ